MDEDNDYGFSYFDNGDDYNDEDDNLDDGPVYWALTATSFPISHKFNKFFFVQKLIFLSLVIRTSQILNSLNAHEVAIERIHSLLFR